MATSKIKINPAGARAVLRHPAVLAELERRAEAIAARAGDGAVAAADLEGNRASAAVIGSDPDALISAIDAGR